MFNKGTNYTPVNLPAPKKLVNPFERMAQQSAESTPTPMSSGKLTWSQRQALAKKQQEEDEERSRAASFKPLSPASTGSKWTPPSARAIHNTKPFGGEEQTTPPSAPPLPNSMRPAAVTSAGAPRGPEVDSEPPAPPVSH